MSFSTVVRSMTGASFCAALAFALSAPSSAQFDPPASATPKPGPTCTLKGLGDDKGLGIVHPASDCSVVIETVDETPRMSQTSEGNYVFIIRFRFYNNLGTPLIPDPAHFTVEDDDKMRHKGYDSGLPELAAYAVSNDFSTRLQPGDSHEYTLGFVLPLGKQGWLYYDAGPN